MLSRRAHKGVVLASSIVHVNTPHRPRPLDKISQTADTNLIENILNEVKEILRRHLLKNRRRFIKIVMKKLLTGVWFLKFSAGVKASIAEPFKEKLDKVKVKFSPVSDKKEQHSETWEKVKTLAKVPMTAYSIKLLAKTVREFRGWLSAMTWP